MKFTYFRFENFKGIRSQILDLSKSPDSQVFTLVGLNESGKTTILEAINYFAYKPETLDPLELDSYQVKDIHSLIPINKRDNFNGYIVVEAGLEFDNEDLTAIGRAFQEKHIKLTSLSNKISYIQKYFFKNSIHIPDKDLVLWTYNFKGIVGKKGRKTRALNNDEALTVNELIKKRLPSILYFPNFLFEFPSKIHLENDDPLNKFYKTIIQDVLNSLDNETNVEEHLTNRIKSENDNERRNLTILKGKMQKQLTTVIFDKWRQIFNKQITNAEIILEHGTDENGAFIEFNIKDDVDTYAIGERSLGFRWFFVYIFLTQFRSFRKEHKNVFFLFDEPASNLHPSAQHELLRSFERLPKVLYTTHSHYLINPKWLENTFVIKNEAIDYDKEEEYKSKNTDIRITKYREFAGKHPNQTSYFQPILEVLDYRPANLELVPKVIITEGKNDFYIYNYFQDIIKKTKKPIKFIPGTSASNLSNLISLYLGWGTNFVVLLDADDEGKGQKARYESEFGITISDRILTYKEIDSEWDGLETEDLFSESDRITIQQSSYPTELSYHKKLFNRSIQELYIGGAKLSLSKESEANLSKVLDTLNASLK